jgi:protein-L-isoaspartate(D-aspartate) O-methyltransferase
MPPPLNPAQAEHHARLQQILARDGVEPWLLAAFERWPRQWFIDHLYLTPPDVTPTAGDWTAVPPDTRDERLLSRIYDDHAVCLQLADGVGVSSSSQPTLMAGMLSQLGVAPGARLLEVGAASGWNAALLADLAGPAGHVLSLEFDAEMAAAAQRHLRDAGAERVEVRCADGVLGAPDAAPFDAIEVTVACPDLPPAWRDQLALGGRLLAPLALPDGSAPLLRLTRAATDAWTGGFQGLTWFVALRGGGLEAWPPPRPLASHPAWPTDTGREHHQDVAVSAERDAYGFFHLTFWLLASLPDLVWLETPAGRRRYGLWRDDPPGLAVLTDDQVHSFGDPEPGRRLTDAVEAWKVAGAPRLENYEVRVLAPDEPRPPLALCRPCCRLGLALRGA